jgi:putative SOS response-associated peptidase YedK
MCFFSKISKTAQEVENRFKVKFDNVQEYRTGNINGFQHPKTPVITNARPHNVQFYKWGLIPAWAKDEKIADNTLNARIETINEKPSFRNVTNNRCLVLADGFYEWQWLDSKGKNKQKYLLTLPNAGLFGFAGLWSEWADKHTGEVIHTYTILTTEANELMAHIHNTKKRMPIIVSENDEQNWLNGGNLIMQNDNLIAIKTSLYS